MSSKRQREDESPPFDRPHAPTESEIALINEVGELLDTFYSPYAGRALDAVRRFAVDVLHVDPTYIDIMLAIESSDSSDEEEEDEEDEEDEEEEEDEPLPPTQVVQ